MTSRALVVALALASSSCAAPSAIDAAADVFLEPSLEIGGGLESFVTLPSEGAELELVHGPQGGWHLHLSMRVRGIVPWNHAWSIQRIDDGELLAYFGRQEREGSFVERGGALERVGEFVILDIRTTAEIVDRDVRVEGIVRDEAGRMVSTALVARVVDLEP